MSYSHIVDGYSTMSQSSLFLQNAVPLESHVTYHRQLHHFTTIYKFSFVASWDSEVSTGCAKSQWKGASMSFGDFLHTVLWKLWIEDILLFSHIVICLLYSREGQPIVHLAVRIR